MGSTPPSRKIFTNRDLSMAVFGAGILYNHHIDCHRCLKGEVMGDLQGHTRSL